MTDIHRHFLGLAVNALRGRGITASYHPNDLTLLLFYASNGKVCTVLKYDPFNQSDGLIYAFTTGDIALSDNFDEEKGRTIPVENTVFGAAKVLLELRQIDLFCQSDCENVAQTAQALTKGHINPDRLARMTQPGPYAAADRRFARYALMADILTPKILDTDKAVIALAEKKGYTSDKLYVACKTRPRASMQLASYETVVDEYKQARIDRLQFLPQTNPRLAKLAFGRQVVFALIQHVWETQDLAKWAVFYARRYFMLTNPDLAYLFCMLNLPSVPCEISDKDNIWAYQVPEPPGDEGSLCSFKRNPDPSLLYNIKFAAPSKKLGTVNQLLARHMISTRLSPDEQAQAEWAKAKLTEIGWKGWFDACVVPICAKRDIRLFEEPALPPAAISALQRMNAEDVWNAMDTMARTLGAPRGMY